MQLVVLMPVQDFKEEAAAFLQEDAEAVEPTDVFETGAEETLTIQQILSEYATVKQGGRMKANLNALNETGPFRISFERSSFDERLEKSRSYDIDSEVGKCYLKDMSNVIKKKSVDLDQLTAASKKA